MNLNICIWKKKLDCILKAKNNKTEENDGDTGTSAHIKFEEVYVKNEPFEFEGSNLDAKEKSSGQLQNNDGMHMETEQKYVKTEGVKEIKQENSFMGKFISKTAKSDCTTDDIWKLDNTVTSNFIEPKQTGESAKTVGVAAPEETHDTARSSLNSSKKKRLVLKSSLQMKRHTCETCGFRTKRKPDLRTHMLTHKNPSEIQMYKCTVCNHETKYIHHLTTHMSTHLDSSKKLYKCELCDYTSHLERKINSHRIVHKDLSEPDTHECHKCDYRTKWKHNLKRHELVHHEDRSQIKTYKCATCDYTTKKKNCFDRHILKHTDSSKEIVYNCKSCDYTTDRKRKLRYHNLIHKKSVGAEVYMCGVCEFKIEVAVK